MPDTPPPGEAPAPYRVDPLTGRRTRIVPARQARPNLPIDGCPFCVGGLEAPDPYAVRAFPNRWPPLPDGRAEIVLYTPEHDATFWSLGVDGARCVVDLWADRSAALGARDDVAYVLVFENRGPEVGATIAHPHGQIYAFDVVPDEPALELRRTGAADGLGRAAAGVHDERLVTEAGGWRAWVPWAARYPYELVLAPVEPVPDLPSLDRACRTGLATVLVDVLARYDARFEEPMPYMLWIHQRPFDGGDWATAWVHVHLAPRRRAPGTARYVAAAELGSDVYFNPVEPEQAAADLRAAGGAP